MNYWFDPVWNINPASNYYFRTCHYQPPGSPPWVSKYFYVIYYYNSPRAIWFYCYDPYYGHNLPGRWWCRARSPLHPQYDPLLFFVLPSTLPPWVNVSNLDMCEQFFPGGPTGATFPGLPGNPLPPLPGDLP